MRYVKTWPDSRRKWAPGAIPPDAPVCAAIAQLVQLMGRYVDSQTPENASLCDDQLNNVLSMSSYIPNKMNLLETYAPNVTKLEKRPPSTYIPYMGTICKLFFRITQVSKIVSWEDTCRNFYRGQSKGALLTNPAITTGKGHISSKEVHRIGEITKYVREERRLRRRREGAAYRTNDSCGLSR